MLVNVLLMVYIQGPFAVRLLLSQWRTVVLQSRLARLENEVKELEAKDEERTSSMWTMRKEAKDEERTSSMWTMRKEELIQKVHDDLGITRAHAESMTVLTLREKLRAHKAAVVRMANPLCVVPKGLEKMTRDQLIQDCIAREITEMVLSDGTGEVTRPKMIVAIREDVERRQQDQKNQSATSAVVPNQKPKPTKAQEMKFNGSDEDMGDWYRY